MRKTIIVLFLLVSVLASAQERAEVELQTTEGNIRIALFNETPQHRDNFMKLVRMQFYDSLLVHRVIKDFMIQSGDLTSRNAKLGQLLGAGELDYTIEPEFRLPQIFHRRGVVAAARESDRVNPERRSGAAQFYIVWGKIYDDKRLARVQERLDSATNGQVKLTPEMIETYKTVGGTPHLDGQYTVFGEVTEGLDVVDRIQQMATDKNDRPIKDVRILSVRIISDPFAPNPVSKPQPKKVVKSQNKVFTVVYATSDDGFLNVRDGASMKNRVLTQLYGPMHGMGSGVLLEHGKNWSKISVGNIVGWVYNKYLGFQTWYDGKGDTVMIANRDEMPIYGESYVDADEYPLFTTVKKGTIIADQFYYFNGYYELHTGHDHLFIKPEDVILRPKSE